MGFIDNLKQQAIYSQIKKLMTDRELKGIYVQLIEDKTSADGLNIDFQYLNEPGEIHSAGEMEKIKTFVRKLQEENTALKNEIVKIKTAPRFA